MCYPRSQENLGIFAVQFGLRYFNPLRTKLTFSSGKNLIFWDNDPLGGGGVGEKLFNDI